MFLASSAQFYQETSCLVSSYHISYLPSKAAEQRILIVLLLLLSGNVQPIPGPELQLIWFQNCSSQCAQFVIQDGHGQNLGQLNRSESE